MWTVIGIVLGGIFTISGTIYATLNHNKQEKKRTYIKKYEEIGILLKDLFDYIDKYIKTVVSYNNPEVETVTLEFDPNINEIAWMIGLYAKSLIPQFEELSVNITKIGLHVGTLSDTPPDKISSHTGISERMSNVIMDQIINLKDDIHMLHVKIFENFKKKKEKKTPGINKLRGIQIY